MYRARMLRGIEKNALNYVSSLSDDLNIAHYDILGSKAHVIMLYEQNLLTKVDLKKILSALNGITNSHLTNNTDSEDIHELIEYLVIKRAGSSSGGKMHTARSRNDQVSLDIRLKIRDDANILAGCITNLIKILLGLAKLHTKTIFPLYTHMQKAQVGVFSHYLLAQVDILFRDLDRLLGVYSRINKNPLGAGPIGGTSLPINRKSVSTMLGFDGIVENSIDATSSRDVAVEFVSVSSILMSNLSRIAEDIVLWSSDEFSFVELSDNFSSPSSVMPQKKNPDILELTRGKAAKTFGLLLAVLSTTKGLATGYSRDLQEMKSSIFDASQISIGALTILAFVFQTIHINKKNMNGAATSGYLVALDLAEQLVTKGIPFRTAHQISGKLVGLAHSKEVPLDKLTVSQISKAVSSPTPKVILSIMKNLTPTESARIRISQGSAGFKNQSSMINQRKKMLDKYNKIINQQTKLVTNAVAKLSSRSSILARNTGQNKNNKSSNRKH